MSISIALCTFNGSRFLQEQLNSFVAQDHRPNELVVCDDGSTDETLRILRRFSDTAPFPVRLEINSSRLGVAANFSRAIELCRCEIIALSDQDDVWMPEKLRKIDAAFSSNPHAGLVFTDAEAVDQAGERLGYRLWDAVLFSHKERRLAHNGHLIDVLVRHNIVTGATLAFRAGYRDLLLPIPPNALHDAWIGLLVAAVAGGYPIDEPLIRYRQHSTQTSGGERMLSLFAQASRARQQSEASLRDVAARYEAAHSRLLASRHGTAARPAIDLIGEKVVHVTARADMRRPGTFRLPLVMREIASGRYSRYSHAWKFVTADLFL